MKTLKFSMMAMLFAAAFAFTACGGNHSHDHDGEQTEQQGKEYTSAYTCPMHCDGSGSHEPGQCPVCGMDYVPNEDQPAKAGEQEHDHDHDHDHDH